MSTYFEDGIPADAAVGLLSGQDREYNPSRKKGNPRRCGGAPAVRAAWKRYEEQSPRMRRWTGHLKQDRHGLHTVPAHSAPTAAKANLQATSPNRKSGGHHLKRKSLNQAATRPQTTAVINSMGMPFRYNRGATPKINFGAPRPGARRQKVKRIGQFVIPKFEYTNSWVISLNSLVTPPTPPL